MIPQFRVPDPWTLCKEMAGVLKDMVTGKSSATDKKAQELYNSIDAKLKEMETGLAKKNIGTAAPDVAFGVERVASGTFSPEPSSADSLRSSGSSLGYDVDLIAEHAGEMQKLLLSSTGILQELQMNTLIGEVHEDLSKLVASMQKGESVEEIKSTVSLCWKKLSVYRNKAENMQGRLDKLIAKLEQHAVKIEDMTDEMKALLNSSTSMLKEVKETKLLENVHGDLSSLVASMQEEALPQLGRELGEKMLAVQAIKDEATQLMKSIGQVQVSSDEREKQQDVAAIKKLTGALDGSMAELHAAIKKSDGESKADPVETLQSKVEGYEKIRAEFKGSVERISGDFSAFLAKVESRERFKQSMKAAAEKRVAPAAKQEERAAGPAPLLKQRILRPQGPSNIRPRGKKPL